MSQPEPIKLELDHVDTVHITSGSQKVASLRVVLKDTGAAEQLINYPSMTSKMIITDIFPCKDDPEKAEILFRHLSNKEIVEESRSFIIPPGSLVEIFGNLLDSLGIKFNENGIIDPQDDPDNFDDLDDLDDEESGDTATINRKNPDSEDFNEEEFEENFKDDETVTAPDLTTLIAATNFSLPEEDTSLYSVTVSLVEAHLGQMICVNTNAPAFVLTSNKQIEENKGHVTVWEDFIALLEFPYLDTPEYFSSTASLTQAVTGVYPLNLTSKQVDSLRGKLLNTILRLSAGDEKALISSFGLINPLQKLFQTVNVNKEDKPSPADIENFFLRNIVDKLYQKTSPYVMAALIKGIPDVKEYVEDINTVNEILANSGLDKVFNEVLESEDTEKGFDFLAVPSLEATHEELISYYSAPIDLYSFPETMRSMVAKIQMPLLYENAWSTDNPNVVETDSNRGEITVAKLITIAVRFARLKVLIHNPSSNLSPIGMLIQGINLPGETDVMWAFTESLALLAEESGYFLFEELLESGLPHPIDEAPPEYLIQTALAALLHKLGHMIAAEDWNKEALTSSLKDKPLLHQFVEDIFESFAKEKLSDEQDGPCGSMLATFSLFSLHPNFKQLIKEFVHTICLLGELNALKNTEYVADSDDWKEYLRTYFRNMIAE